MLKYKIYHEYIRKDSTIMEGDEERIKNCLTPNPFECLKDARACLKRIVEDEDYNYISPSELMAYKEVIRYDEETYIESVEKEILTIEFIRE